MVIAFSLTKDVFKDLIYNVQSKAKVAGQTNVPVDASSWNETKMVFEAMEYIMSETARVWRMNHLLCFLIRSYLQDIIRNTEKYSLSLDIRTAAYAKAIQNLFKITLDSK